MDVDALKAWIFEFSPFEWYDYERNEYDWEFAYADRVWKNFDEFYAYGTCVFDYECNTESFYNGSASLLVASLVTMLTAACMLSI